MQSTDRATPPAAPAHWADPAPERTSSYTGGRNVRALAEVMFATHDGPPPAHMLAWHAERVAQMQRSIGGRGMLVFRLAIFLATWVAPLWSFRLPRLARLPLAKRAHVLERWERSPAGLTLFAAKAILCIAWFEHPDAARAIDFDGQPLVSPQPDGAHG